MALDRGAVEFDKLALLRGRMEKWQYSLRSWTSKASAIDAMEVVGSSRRASFFGKKASKDHPQHEI